MSETEAYTHFVEPMRRRFTVPSGIDPDLFSADLAEALANYTIYQLQCAANHFRDHRTQRSFPTIAECRQSCERFTEVPKAQATVTGAFEPDAIKKSLEHTALLNRIEAFKLCRCQLGRVANEEGWLGRLIDFASDHQRLPNEREVSTIKAAQREADRSLERLRPPVEGSHWSLAEQAALYEKMAGFREAFKAKAYNDVFGFIEKKRDAA